MTEENYRNNYAPDENGRSDYNAGRQYSDPRFTYGNNPYYGNSGDAYRNSYDPYASPYGNPYGRQPKKGIVSRIREYFQKKPYNGIAVFSAFHSIGIILYLMLSSAIGTFIVIISGLGGNIFEDTGMSVLGMLSSVFCVGLPFIVVWCLMRRYDKTCFDIPFGKPRKNSHVLLLILAGMGFCYMGNIITGYFTAIFQSFGIDFASTEAAAALTDTPDTPMGFVLNLMYVAVLPAFFEEIAFRGVIMQPLRKYGDWFAIGISAVIFGLIHGNMTQMPFAICAGIALGYVFIVTGSIWPSVIIHFLNNSLALVCNEMLSRLSETGAMLFSAVFIYGIIAVGVVSFIAYTKLNKNYRKLRKGEYTGLRTKRKVNVYFLMPPMLFAVAVLIMNVLSDMVLGGLT